jgi:uncharacterized protein (TIGR03382 family)
MRSVVCFFGVSALMLSVTAGAKADIVSYDHMTNQPATAWNLLSGGGSPASTGSRFLGSVITLAGGATTITGFDATMVNNTGAALTFTAGQQVRLNYWIWNNWTPSVGTDPAFSNLAGSGNVGFNVGGLSLPANNFLFFTQNAAAGPGQVPAASTLPGIAITPVTVASSGPIGITLHWQINRNDGAGFVPLGGLSSVVVGGVGGTAVAPVVGTNNFGGVNLGYYRSASAENNGNFLGSSARNIGPNSGAMLRVYTIPSPGAAALLGLGGAVALRRRRK